MTGKAEDSTMIEGTGARSPLMQLLARAPRQVEAGEPSSRSTEARGPMRSMTSEPAPFDGARVERVRAAIADGSYLIEPMRIAERMIALDFPQPRT